jgi:PH (Pleckstrin Homology) domain-containing protein/putative oligomerization/nucleic acid binding protein
MADDRAQAIAEAMQKAGGVGWQTRGEVKELPRILWPDELPLKVIRGSYGSGAGILVATDRRLIFIDKGLMSLKVEDFGYDKITSVQYRTGMVLGEIDVLASGNRATFKNIEKARVREFGDWLRARISAPKASAAPASMPSASEEIARMADLHRQGILTDEEFAAKKKQLLGL